MLKPNTASEIAAPGNSAIHGARYMNERPDPESIPPHEGYGGGIPNPRNESADSARITVPRPMVATMMTVASTFGSTWRTTMRQCPEPSARAASTYGFCIVEGSAPRLTTEVPAAPRIDSAMIKFSRPGPSAATSESTITRAGNEIQASTTRWTRMSKVPPRYALETPTIVARSVVSAMVANPTVTEIRAPYTTRLQMSRPRLSVPIQNCALGGFMRAPRIVSSYV